MFHNHVSRTSETPLLGYSVYALCVSKLIIEDKNPKIKDYI